jgi:hypothetical protein
MRVRAIVKKGRPNVTRRDKFVRLLLYDDINIIYYVRHIIYLVLRLAIVR